MGCSSPPPVVALKRTVPETMMYRCSPGSPCRNKVSPSPAWTMTAEPARSSSSGSPRVENSAHPLRSGRRSRPGTPSMGRISCGDDFTDLLQPNAIELLGGASVLGILSPGHLQQQGRVGCGVLRHLPRQTVREGDPAVPPGPWENHHHFSRVPPRENQVGGPPNERSSHRQQVVHGTLVLLLAAGAYGVGALQPSHDKRHGTLELGGSGDFRGQCPHQELLLRQDRNHEREMAARARLDRKSV